jgi:hypothetical protein
MRGWCEVKRGWDESPRYVVQAALGRCKSSKEYCHFKTVAVEKKGTTIQKNTVIPNPALKSVGTSMKRKRGEGSAVVWIALNVNGPSLRLPQGS